MMRLQKREKHLRDAEEQLANVLIENRKIFNVITAHKASAPFAF
jgi:hypothetical protein